jgi:hypothetical protein
MAANSAIRDFDMSYPIDAGASTVARAAGAEIDSIVSNFS